MAWIENILAEGESALRLKNDLEYFSQTALIEPYGPTIIGVDPAGSGPDRTALAWRRGRSITKIESWRGLSTMDIAGLVNRLIREEKPDRTNVDVTGLGVGVYNRLIELGHRGLVNAINFAGKPVEPAPLDETGKPGGGPANRRAEMWNNLKRALDEGRFSLPDDDALQADLVSCGYKYNSSGQLLLESKDEMRRRGVPSPDLADAVALCFASPDGFPRSGKFHQSSKDRYKGLYV
jgi:hypothetical protein